MARREQERREQARREQARREQGVFPIVGLIIFVFMFLLISIKFSYTIEDNCEQVETLTLSQEGNSSENQVLARYGSCQELGESFKTSNCVWFHNYWDNEETVPSYGNIPPTRESKVTSGEGANYTSTNNQVKGVDEADVLKTDGHYFYKLSGDGNKNLLIAKAWPADSLNVLTTIDLAKEFDIWPTDMFLHEDVLTVYGTSSFRKNYLKTSYRARRLRGLSHEMETVIVDEYYFSTTSVLVFNITDRNRKPQLLRRLDFEGQYVSSRKVRDRVTFITESFPRYYARDYTSWTERDILPLFRDFEAAKDGLEKKETNSTGDYSYVFGTTCACNDVVKPANVAIQSFLTTCTISLSEPLGQIETKTIAGRGGNVYASKTHLFVASTLNYGDEKMATSVAAFATKHDAPLSNEGGKGSAVKFEGNIQFPGTIINQFAMDQYLDMFRIVTTTKFTSEVENNVYTYNVYTYNLTNLNINSILYPDGRLEGLATGERMHSTRFMGPKLFLVTFEKVDPLFVIELSELKSPKVLGLLKLPGYSDYLHPVNDTHLISLGRNVQIVNGNEEISLGIKVSLFDISNYTFPQELYSISIGDRGTQSEAAYNHKSFFYSDSDLFGEPTLILPIHLSKIECGDKFDEFGYPNWGSPVWNGVMMFSLQPTGFHTVGNISHDQSEFSNCDFHEFNHQHSIQRVAVLNDQADTFFYSFSARTISVHKHENMSFTALRNVSHEA